MLSIGETQSAAFARNWMQPKNRLRDDTQSPKRSCSQLGQVISGDVLHDLAAALRESAVGQSQRDADNQIAQTSEANAQRPTIIGRENPSDRRLLRPQWVKRQSLTMLGQRSLKFLERTSSFDRRRHVAPCMFHDTVQPTGGKNQLAAAAFDILEQDCPNPSCSRCRAESPSNPRPSRSSARQQLHRDSPAR